MTAPVDPRVTQQSVTGFIASELQLTFTTQGDARFYAKIGQEHYHRNDDASFTQLDTTSHDLVIYRRSAERADAAFAKGDKFVAEGSVRTYEHVGFLGTSSWRRTRPRPSWPGPVHMKLG